KTSMLQDIEAGRAIEADALIGSIIELGQIAGVATPQIEAIYACVKLLSATLAKTGGHLRIEKA
ncbi:MAG TPA: ketopantoate reductase C-terminal domain-containing protein, partial [Hyphomicrobium sp.]